MLRKGNGQQPEIRFPWRRYKPARSAGQGRHGQVSQRHGDLDQATAAS